MSNLYAQDYFPFGSVMDGRSYNNEKYRFAFNGKEVEAGMDGVYAFEARMFDSRIARWFSTDPRESEYAWQSTYAYYRNSPIATIDLFGMGGDDPPEDRDFTFTQNGSSSSGGQNDLEDRFRGSESLTANANNASSNATYQVPPVDMLAGAQETTSGQAVYPYNAFVGALPEFATRAAANNEEPYKGKLKFNYKIQEITNNHCDIEDGKEDDNGNSTPVCDNRLYENQCAIRLSKAIIDAGIPLKGYTGGICEHGHARGAESLYKWIKKNSACAQEQILIWNNNKDIKKFEDKYFGSYGILYYTKKDGSSFHITSLGNLGVAGTKYKGPNLRVHFIQITSLTIEHPCKE